MEETDGTVQGTHKTPVSLGWMQPAHQGTLAFPLSIHHHPPARSQMLNMGQALSWSSACPAAKPAAVRLCFLPLSIQRHLVLLTLCPRAWTLGYPSCLKATQRWEGRTRSFLAGEVI